MKDENSEIGTGMDCIAEIIILPVPPTSIAAKTVVFYEHLFGWPEPACFRRFAHSDERKFPF
jgi:hypothetical protein